MMKATHKKFIYRIRSTDERNRQCWRFAMDLETAQKLGSDIYKRTSMGRFERVVL